MKKRSMTKVAKPKKPKLGVTKIPTPKFGRQQSPRGGMKMPKMPGAGSY